MRKHIELYLHLIWRTWDSEPLITPEIEQRLYRVIQNEVQQLGCTVLALNGVSDHVHLLVCLPTTITIANLLKQVKGVSSHFVNEVLQLDFHFKWQGGYGAFTVSRWDVEKIKHYIKRQKEHHAAGELWDDLEQATEMAQAPASM